MVRRDGGEFCFERRTLVVVKDLGARDEFARLIRNRLREVIRAMGYEPGREETQDLSEEKRRSVLEELENGAISAEDAMRRLRGEEE